MTGVPAPGPAPAPLSPGWTIPLRIVVMIMVTGAAILGLALLLAAAGTGDAAAPTALMGRIVGGVAVSALVITLVVLASRLVEHRRVETVGLSTPRRAGPELLAGMVVWLVPAAAAFATLAAFGHRISVTAPAGRVAMVIGLLFLAVLLSEAVPEEIVFRGYLTAVLSERLRGWWVVLVQTALFSLTASVLRGGVGVLDLSMFVAMGVVLGQLRAMTGSVWTAVGFHTAFQTGSQLLLTQPVIEFGGGQTQAMIALGAVPFSVLMIGLSVVTAVRPTLLTCGRVGR